jgi:hypothetical protein
VLAAINKTSRTHDGVTLLESCGIDKHRGVFGGLAGVVDDGSGDACGVF